MLRARATESHERPLLDILYVNTALLSVSSQTLHVKTPVSHAPQIPSQCQIPMALPMAETSRQGIPRQSLATQLIGSYPMPVGMPEKYIQLMVLIFILIHIRCIPCQCSPYARRPLRIPCPPPRHSSVLLLIVRGRFTEGKR